MNEELLHDLNARVSALEAKQGSLRYPIDPNSQGAVENTLFKVVKALQFVGGLPIFTAARTDNRLQGEIYATNIGGSIAINIYVGGTQYSSYLN